MSPLSGFPSLADGSLDLDGTTAIASVYNGLPLTAAGKVAVAVEGAPAGDPHNGFLFTAAGRLCVSSANAVAVIHNGFGYDAAGRLCIAAAGGIGQHSANFDATGKAIATVA